MRLKRLMSLLLALVFMLSALPASGAEELLMFVRSAPLLKSSEILNGMVRVYLSSLGNVTSLDLTVVGSYSVSGAYSLTLYDGQKVNAAFDTATGQITLTVGGVSYPMGSEVVLRRHQSDGQSALKIAQANRPNNMYPGDLQLLARTSGSAYKLYPIVHVYIEYYLYGVVPYEMSSSWPAEALKAQAVAARTYTLNRMNGRTSSTYDLVDTSSDQVYNGFVGTETNATRAVDATKGIVIMNDGKLSGTYYTASNGGQTEAVANAWGSTGYPYLGVKDDPFDRANPNTNKRRLDVYVNFNDASQDATFKSLLTAKAQSLYGADVSILTINSVTPHTPKYAAPSRLYTKMDFGVTLSTGTAATLTFDIFGELESPLGMSINSSKNELWYVERQGECFIVRAARYGHGIGMSQRGAQQMSGMGYTYDQILGFYYEGCDRIQYTFTHTILPPIGSGNAPVVATEAPATIEPETGTNARVSLPGVSDVAPLRYAPSHSAKVLTTIGNGTSVHVLNWGSEWTLIRYGVINGYIPTSNLITTGIPPADATAYATNITQWATVTGSESLNLRSGGSYSDSVIGSIPGGTVIPVLSNNGSWAYVQYGQQPGYCAVSYLTLSSTYPAEITGSGSSAMVSLGSANSSAPLYATASTQGTVILNVDHGTQVDVLSNDGSWCRVTVGSVTGYMLTSVLDFGSIGVAPTEPPVTEDERYAIVASEASTLNLRSGPGTNYNVIAEIPKGTQIVVTSYGSEWCAVRWGSLTGYVMTQYLSFETTSPTPTPTTAPTPTATPTPSFTPVEATGLVLNATQIRMTPDEAGTPIMSLPADTMVNVLQVGDEWCQVECAGTVGWMPADQLRILEQEETPTPTPTATPTVTPSPAPTTSGDEGLVTDLDITHTGRMAWIVPSVTSVNLRAEASDEAEILCEIPANAYLISYETRPTWTYVVYEGTSGYVYTRYITYTEPVEALGTRYINTVRDPLAMRDAPSTSGKLITRINRGVAVTLLEELGDWCKVSYNGQTGYCAARYLSTVKPAKYVADDTRILDWTLTPVTGWTAVITPKDGGSLFAREWCSLEAPEVMELQPDTVVTVIQKGDIWCLIAMEGNEGYCLTSQITLQPPAN